MKAVRNKLLAACAFLLSLLFVGYSPIPGGAGLSIIEVVGSGTLSRLFALVGALALVLYPMIWRISQGLRVDSGTVRRFLPWLNKVYLASALIALPGAFFGLFLIGHMFFNGLFFLTDLNLRFDSVGFWSSAADWKPIVAYSVFVVTGCLLFWLVKGDLRPLFYVGSEKIWGTLSDQGSFWRLHLKRIDSKSLHGEVGQMMKFVSKLSSDYRPDRIEMDSHLLFDSRWVEFVKRRADRIGYDVLVESPRRYTSFQKWFLSRVNSALKERYREGKLVGHRRIILTKKIEE